MTAEEKKAIEYLNNYIKDDKEDIKILNSTSDEDIDYYNEVAPIERRLKYLETIKNLIEKLQKENEERKSEIEIFYKWLSFTCKELGISEDTPIIDMLNEFKNNYIPKSKIKNLKEELNNFDISFYDKETLKEAVSNSLKELLEEE